MVIQDRARAGESLEYSQSIASSAWDCGRNCPGAGELKEEMFWRGVHSADWAFPEPRIKVHTWRKNRGEYRYMNNCVAGKLCQDNLEESLRNTCLFLKFLFHAAMIWDKPRADFSLK